MSEHLIPAGGGPDYDWSNDHMYVKTPMELTDGRVTVVEDVLKPGFHLPKHHHRSMVEIFYVLEGEVSFTFESGTLLATKGCTVNVPPNARHEVSSPGGARLITIFTPGGFDHYLADLAVLSPAEMDDANRMSELSQRYDIWPD